MSRTHATRTCHYCGLRAPQPEMQRREIMVDTGRSRSSMSVATFAGAALGNKAARRSILSAIFNSAARKYQRRQEIWACGQESCPGGADASIRGWLLPALLLGGLILGVFALCVWLGFGWWHFLDRFV